MLVLARKIGERVIIGDGIIVTVVDVRSDMTVRLGFTAPAETRVDREEIREIRTAEVRFPLGGLAKPAKKKG